jgi:predicted acetyltransferase
VTLEIRNVRDEELPAFIDAMSTGFLERPDVDKVAAEVRLNWDLTRSWAGFESGQITGTWRSWETEITVPGGKRLPGGAVSAVSVIPTHRRRGILTALVDAAHRAMRDGGEAMGLLYAAEYPIYGRFGYGPACREATWTVETRGTRFVTHASGGVELAKPDGDASAAIKALFETWRLRQPGELRRRDYIWEYDLGRDTAWGSRWKGFLLFHRDAGGKLDGYARYHVEDKWERRQPLSNLVLDELHALTDDAYAALWRSLAETDWAATIKAEHRTPAERLPWLMTNARAASMSDVGDGMWIRLFDVPRALAARTYDREGSFVLEVVDREAPDGRLRVLLEAGPAGATCAATDRSADLTLDIAALSAAYLGGTPLRHAVAASGVDEHRSGVLLKADALLRTLDEPWTSTFF